MQGLCVKRLLTLTACPAANFSRIDANSPMFANRSSGRFANTLKIMDSTYAGMLWIILRGWGTGSFTCLSRISHRSVRSEWPMSRNHLKEDNSQCILIG